MKQVTIIFNIPKDDCSKCPMYEEIETDEVGLSFPDHFCNLFKMMLKPTSINTPKVQRCFKCKSLYNKGKMNFE